MENEKIMCKDCKYFCYKYGKYGDCINPIISTEHSMILPSGHIRKDNDFNISDRFGCIYAEKK